MTQQSTTEWFRALEANRPQLRALLEGSHIFSNQEPTLDSWIKRRRFVARGVHTRGPFLDIGCANGFFLRSLQEWSPYAIVPYGIDTNAELVNKARILFPRQSDHFAVAAFRDVSRLAHFGLPSHFTFVYLNLWDGWTFTSVDEVTLLRAARSTVLPGGRLLLSIHRSTPEIDRIIATLQDVGLPISRLVPNEEGEYGAMIISAV